jgi:hypothetical protein
VLVDKENKMIQKSPQNTSQYYWTEHVKFKMRFYGLSEQKIIGVISNPKRKEEGIVEKTIAVMKPVSPKMVSGKEVWKQEVWVMYQKKCKNKKSIRRPTDKILEKNPLKIISAWRYPGVSPQKNPIPEEILREVLKNI